MSRRPVDLDGKENLFGIADSDGNGRGAALRHRRMGVARSGLEILRIEVASADDDDVLEAAADIQLAVDQRAEIAGAKIGTVSLAGEGTEGLRRRLRLAPISQRHTGG